MSHHDPTPSLDRRAFLGAAAAASATVWPLGTARAATTPLPAARTPVVISSANGRRSIGMARTMVVDGADPTDAVVAAVTVVEDDPTDMSVGYGGLPNEAGVVQLDASVMHGPTHKAGAVAALEDIRNPAKVALAVLRHTDHVLLVGAGARDFAIAMGFEPQNMLTDAARQAWLRWKMNLNADDDWLDTDQLTGPPEKTALFDRRGIPHTWGTIHCAGVDANGDIGACTTTSGLSYKLPGRVGDSPIIGAGMFVDNAIGAAGATGRGESVIQSCGSFQIVEHMGRGDDPATACLKALQWIADHTRRPMLLNEAGEPSFGCTFYALRKDGAYGSATMHKGPSFAVCDGGDARLEKCAYLFE